MTHVTPPVQDAHDILVFSDHCVFMRSVYLRGKILFEHSSAKDRARESRPKYVDRSRTLTTAR
jgi:hypothetical protein